MTITTETEVAVIDPEAGVVEWVGPWGDLVEANELGEDAVAEMARSLSERGCVPVGGGAAPTFLIYLNR
jgi:hypothetical protein